MSSKRVRTLRTDPMKMDVTPDGETMDNLAAHQGKRIKELIKERGCGLLYLPPYCPDPDPVEETFSKVMWLLREAARPKFSGA